MIQFFIGVLMSFLHVITGPDHLAAVTPLAIENKKKAWHVGFFWGVGHVLGMLIIGGIYLAFREIVNVDVISGYSEYLVGIVLIGIGAWSVFKVFIQINKHHNHPHYHATPEPIVHIHKHEHHNEFDHEHIHEKLSRQNNTTALGVGTLHGFAGISHFLLILPTLALPTIFDSVIYLAGFIIGTILTMVTYALVMGFVAVKSANFQNSKIFPSLRLSAGIIAILVGIFWLFNT